MKKSKQLFKFLFIIGILLFYSCEKDDLVLNDKELSNSNPFKIEKLTFQQASKNHKLIQKLNTFSSNSNFNKRIISNYDNDIFIDTEIVTFIEDLNGNHSYIFSIYSSNSNYLLENLVLSNSDNGYRANIIQYDITENELEELKNGSNTVLNSNNVLLKPFDLNSLNGSLFKNGYSVCSCGLNIYTGDDGLNYVVDQIYTDGTITWIQHNCSGGGSSSGSSGSDNSDGSPPGNTDGSTGSTGNGNTDGGYNPSSGYTGGTSGVGSLPNNTAPKPIITTPVGLDGTKVKDPCVNAILENNKTKTIFNQPDFQTKLSQINSSIPTDAVEKGFNFGTIPSNGNFVTTDVKIGTATGINLPVTNPNFNVTGSMHTHNGTDGFDSFSPADFYRFTEAHTANSNFGTMFVIGATGEIYSLTITDPGLFANFVNFYPKANHFDPTTNGWKKGSPLYIAFMEAFRNLFEEQGKTADEAYALANAYVLKKFNAGMSISKKNSNGDFETLFVEEKKDPNDETKTIFEQTSTCNL